MSLATWKAEFYPVEASAVSAGEAAAHSLRKWEGLLPEVMKRHGVWIAFGSVVECEPPCRGAVFIDAKTCALCERYWTKGADDPCATCPLAIARGDFGCSELRHDDDLVYENASPWERWVNHQDPVPMIHWLRVTVEGGAA